MNKTIALRPITVAVLALMLAACGGGGIDGDEAGTAPAPVPEPARPQDSRTFTAAAMATTFAAMAAAPGDTVDMATTSRYAGTLDGAAYQIEVPANWNGKLVMYAHGFGGNRAHCQRQRPTDPPPPDPAMATPGPRPATAELLRRARRRRRHQRLALNIQRASPPQNGRTLARTDQAPTLSALHGWPHHWRGHRGRGRRHRQQQGALRRAVPMCGVMGDAELFNQFAACRSRPAAGWHACPPGPSANWAEQAPR
jgi:hypothetical protein